MTVRKAFILTCLLLCLSIFAAGAEVMMKVYVPYDEEQAGDDGTDLHQGRETRGDEDEIGSQFAEGVPMVVGSASAFYQDQKTTSSTLPYARIVYRNISKTAYTTHTTTTRAEPAMVGFTTAPEPGNRAWEAIVSFLRRLL
ncbi:MAG: hypothetical protein GF416_02275 [Candidatus Altiarchaeales archaeon]|nr:hypothetical protein [Candidatus Altiarchaeales archaeon]MBD3415945.1 hypothetical protein [Candidatus Altiarchaeales archaeon]